MADHFTTTHYQHLAPTYRLVVAGQDITPKLNGRLESLSITEGRENQADQLDLVLQDHDGQVIIPPKEAEIKLYIGWEGQPLIDKGSYVVDEVEHSGAPDQLTIRARAADMGGEIRTRKEKSWHNTTLGDVLAEIAKRNGLTHKVEQALSRIPIAHLDQTNESDMHLLTRLARKHDAVATVKKKHLLFMPINGTKNSKGQSLPQITITRKDGDKHRWATSARDAFDGVRAWWSNSVNGKRKEVITGKKTRNMKTLKETYASEQDALAAAKAELQRLVRGGATFDLALAIGRPEITAQSPIVVRGFKQEIDGQNWLVKGVTHSIADGGYTTKLECERLGSEDTQASAENGKSD